MKMLLLPLLLISIVNISFCSDLVMNLPDYPFQGRMFSGYLNLQNPKKKLHYLFIESGNDPKNDPLILWLNGGPGCSSMLGWAQEHGPASMEENSDKFRMNNYSWHKTANMIYLESPAGVGYSYVDSTKEEDLAMDDHISGRENLEALVDFFKRYPSFKNNEFYVSGESYAGIYVPTLASFILDHNQMQPASKKINLKGIIVGNGVTDWKVDTNPALIDFAYTHSLYSPELRKQYLDECGTERKDQKKCEELEDKIANFCQKSVNIYDIYRECFRPPQKIENNFFSFLTKDKSDNVSYDYTPWLRRKSKRNADSKFLTYLAEGEDEGETPPCVDGAGPAKYFNRFDVKVAFNVKTDIHWGMCNNYIGEHYLRDMEKGSYYLYPKLIQAKLKILIYSGDTDAAVPINGTQKWISNLKLPVVSAWRSWRTDSNMVAGYRTIYEGLTFVTVKGTGHMVPQWKPKEAFYMLTRFLKNQDL